MSFKEVKELRTTGKLSEALELAQKALEQDSTNIWNKRSLAWVYYEFIKQNSNIQQFEVFKEYLNKLLELNLPVDEKMIFDYCAYQIGKLIKSFNSSDRTDLGRLNELFVLVQTMNFSKPSEAYTFLYKMFHKFHDVWSGHIKFVDWWGFENFRNEDFLSEEYNGKKIMSLVEQAYIAYSKKLIEGESKIVDGLILPKSIDKVKITEFLTKLDVIVESHPEYQYPPYFKAKLLLALGDNENVLSAFLPFARKKRNDFWVWDLLSEIFLSEDNRRFACLCKALTLKTPEDFLIKLRHKMAVVLVAQNKHTEAKTEIEKIIAVRNEHKWNIPPEIIDWTKSDWYKQASANKNNLLFYRQYTTIAEDILFSDIPEELVVVEYVNEDKSMISFVKDKSKSGFFNYQGLVYKPVIGEVYNVRFANDVKESFYKILTARKITETNDSPAKLSFKGKIKKIEKSDICFVENVFINAVLTSKHSLNHNDTINGIAILSFNKKKNDWGWKAITISK